KLIGNAANIGHGQIGKMPSSRNTPQITFNQRNLRTIHSNVGSSGSHGDSLGGNDAVGGSHDHTYPRFLRSLTAAVCCAWSDLIPPANPLTCHQQPSTASYVARQL